MKLILFLLGTSVPIFMLLAEQQLAKKVVLRANKDNYGLSIQQAIALDLNSKKIVGTRNSNFVCGASENVFLGTIIDRAGKYDLISGGHFRAMEYEMRAKDPKVALLKNELIKERHIQPHVIRTFINKEAIKREKESGQILKYLGSNCTRFATRDLFQNGTLLTVKKIKNKTTRKYYYELYEVIVKDGKLSAPKLIPFGKYNCKKSDMAFECLIPNKGLAILKA